MLDHLDVRVSDVARSVAFYKTLLATLGISQRDEAEFGDEQNYIWLGKGVVKRMHFAFTAQTRQQVDDFWQAAVEIGARLLTAPAEQESDYYSCFLFDPDGHLIEAVCHGKKL